MKFQDALAAQFGTVPRIELTDDAWRAYFYKFDQSHGGCSVQVGGELVYPDGWRYSATAYEGPEYPPPKDPERLRRLQLSYWRCRRPLVAAELRKAERTIAELESLDRSLPVVAEVRGTDGDLIDLDDLRELRRNLAAALEECEQRIAGLESAQKQGA